LDWQERLTFSFTACAIQAKALERFMQDLLDEAAKETQAKGARKVTIHHLCVAM
jgi:hypothetical protein